MHDNTSEESGNESDMESIPRKSKPEPHYSDWLIGSRGIPVESQAALTVASTKKKMKRISNSRSSGGSLDGSVNTANETKR